MNSGPASGRLPGLEAIYAGPVERNAPLADKTTFRLGGRAGEQGTDVAAGDGQQAQYDDQDVPASHDMPPRSGG